MSAFLQVVDFKMQSNVQEILGEILFKCKGGGSREVDSDGLSGHGDLWTRVKEEKGGRQEG